MFVVAVVPAIHSFSVFLLNFPSGKDVESRIKVAIKKSEQRNMEELPSEFDMTVFYALNIYPIRFKIRPNQGQKIERIKEDKDNFER